MCRGAHYIAYQCADLVVIVWVMFFSTPSLSEKLMLTGLVWYLMLTFVMFWSYIPWAEHCYQDSYSIPGLQFCDKNGSRKNVNSAVLNIILRFFAT